MANPKTKTWAEVDAEMPVLEEVKPTPETKEEQSQRDALDSIAEEIYNREQMKSVFWNPTLGEALAWKTRKS